MKRRDFFKLFASGVGFAAVPNVVLAKPTIWERVASKFKRKEVSTGAFFDKSYLPYVHKLILTQVTEPDVMVLGENGYVLHSKMDELVMAEVQRVLAEERVA